MTTKQSEEYSWTNALRIRQQTLLLLDFDWVLTWYHNLLLTFHWFISARLRYILAHQSSMLARGTDAAQCPTKWILFSIQF